MSASTNDLSAVNARFNEALARQIAGTLPPGHVYQLGRPGRILLSAGIPDLPIEMAAARLLHKSNQENHPFELTEVRDLVTAIQTPLAVFRSATRLDSKVIMTELQHAGKNVFRQPSAEDELVRTMPRCEKGRMKSNHFDKPNEQRTSLLGLCHGEKWCAKANFVVAIHMNKAKGRIFINDIRSVHYRSSDMHIINWINNELADYIAPDFEVKWLDPIKKEFRSKPQYNSAEVRTKLFSATKIVQAEHKSK